MGTSSLKWDSTVLPGNQGQQLEHNAVPLPSFSPFLFVFFSATYFYCNYCSTFPSCLTIVDVVISGVIGSQHWDGVTA